MAAPDRFSADSIDAAGFCGRGNGTWEGRRDVREGGKEEPKEV